MSMPPITGRIEAVGDVTHEWGERGHFVEAMFRECGPFVGDYPPATRRRFEIDGTIVVREIPVDQQSTPKT